MRDDRDARSLVQALGSAAVGVGIGLGVLVAGFFISRLTLADSTTVVAVSAAPATPTRSPSPTPRPTAPFSPTLAPTPAPTVAPTLPPAPTPDPMVVSAFRGQELSLAGLTIPVGYTVTSPIAGTVTIEVYQYVDGRIVTGVTDQPSYPYVFVKSSDRLIKLRPGIIGKDVQLLVRDGDTIPSGAPLFKTLTTGASSWATFYDNSVTAQVVVSASNAATGAGIDPVALFKK